MHRWLSLLVVLLWVVEVHCTSFVRSHFNDINITWLAVSFLINTWLAVSFLVNTGATSIPYELSILPNTTTGDRSH